MIRPPSLFRPYDICYSRDPALKQAPSDLTELKAYEATLAACRETGDWSPLANESQVPTRFTVGQIDRNIFRAIGDRMSLPESSPRRIGPVELFSLVFRLAIRSISNLDGVTIERAADPQWDGWVMARADIITALDEIDVGIVNELGSYIFYRTSNLLKKA